MTWTDRFLRSSRRGIWRSLGVKPKGSLVMDRESTVRLSNAQKRDLLGMSAAAMITTALIAAPMLLPHDSGAPLLVNPSILMAEAIPTPALIPMRSRAVESVSGRMSPVAAPRRRRERAVLPSSPVRLASMPIATVAPPVLVAVEASNARPSKPLGKRLAGLLPGDGTYTVRPFPTIPTERQ